MPPIALTTAPAVARPSSASATPPPPETLADTGLSSGLVIELLLKALYHRGSVVATELAEILGLSYLIVDDLLLDLQHHRLLHVQGGKEGGRKSYRYELTEAGRIRAREAFAVSQYVGRAPVPLEQYTACVEAQSWRSFQVTRARIQEAFSQLVLDMPILEMLGPAVNTARAILLYGGSGNGKTLIAETLARVLGGAIYVPHALLVEGQIVSLYDPVHHQLANDEEQEAEHRAPRPAWLPEGEKLSEETVAWFAPADTYDSRYMRVKRPAVLTGGELTLEQLDLRRDPKTNVLQAPVQLRANGGVLIIDDLGRQRVPAHSLLNRWLVPLEKRVDHLTLPTGETVPVPFDCLVIFATDMDLEAMVDGAFLRRIPYKIQVTGPTRLQWEEIFRLACQARGLTFRSRAVDYVFDEYYHRRAISPRACHSRDLLDCLVGTAHYLEVEPALSDDLLERACGAYFTNVRGWNADAREGR